VAKFTPKVAVELANLTARLARYSGKWGGTTLPGKVALKLWPTATAELSSKLKLGSVLLSGTNGKTTTARILAGCAEAEGLAVCANSAGANLTSGVTSALLQLAKNPSDSSRAGSNSHPQKTAPELGVFEVDEAALPEVASLTQPRMVILLNLFRDQLDRHGELESLANRWREMIGKLDSQTLLLVNADDPGLVAIAESNEDAFYFGLTDDSVNRGALPHAADVTRCGQCRTELSYNCHTIGHLGSWFCPECGWQRPALDFAATEVELMESVGESEPVAGGELVAGEPQAAEGKLAIESDLGAKEKPKPQICFTFMGQQLSSTLPGLHNVYNSLAAASAARLLDISNSAISQAIHATAPAFGRAEEVLLQDRRLLIFLAKNPTGANENIQTIMRFRQPITLLVTLNDRVADGHDVSWIWDVDYEPLFEKAERIVFSGDRAHEIALRYRYGSQNTDFKTENPIVLPPMAQALDWALKATPKGGLVVALPTYTATLELRAELSSRGAVRPFWEQG